MEALIPDRHQATFDAPISGMNYFACWYFVGVPAVLLALRRAAHDRGDRRCDARHGGGARRRQTAGELNREARRHLGLDPQSA
jgi:hypothetical protein